jgi:alpha-ketoglutarate-dependent taurine dioxygenase
MTEALTATTRIGVIQLAGNIGAEITGVDTGVPLNGGVVARIRQALLDHKVVFLRGQRPFNHGEQVDPALAAAQEEFVSTVYETEHPLVRVHPARADGPLALARGRPGRGGRAAKRRGQGRRFRVLRRRRERLDDSHSKAGIDEQLS